MENKCNTLRLALLTILSLILGEAALAKLVKCSRAGKESIPGLPFTKPQRVKSHSDRNLVRCILQFRRRQWQPTPVLLPGKSHGRRGLVGCSPWGRSESDRTERLHFHFSLSCIGEGNGNPLQCSCLENPRDGGAWWAAVYGVAQNWTWLKRLSSSSREGWRLLGFKKYESLEKETVSLRWRFPKLEWGLLWTPETPTLTTLDWVYKGQKEISIRVWAHVPSQTWLMTCCRTQTLYALRFADLVLLLSI